MWVSLYEYFGKPVGGEIGKQVYNASKRARVRVKIKEISNPKYRGKVMTYPVSWLDSYFTQNFETFKHLKSPSAITVTSANTSNIVISKYDTKPCAEISLSPTIEKKKQTLNFY